MRTAQDIINEMQAKRDELEGLTKLKNPTRSQEMRFAQGVEDIEKLDEELRELRRAEGEQRMNAALSDPNTKFVSGASGTPDYDPNTGRMVRDAQGDPIGATMRRGRTGDPATDGARSVIDTAHQRGQLPDHAAETAEKLVTTGSDESRSLAARWAEATGNEHYRTAFTKILADPDHGHREFSGDELQAYRAVRDVQRAMAVGTDSSGGAMVPLTLDPAIMLTGPGSVNPLRQMARVVQTTTNQWDGVSSAGVTAEWLAESAEASDASPTLSQPSVPVHKGSAFVPFSVEFGMDAVDAMTELQRLLADSADQLQAEAYVTGSGTGQPTGFVTALAGTTSELAAGTDDTFAASDVFALQNALPPRFQPRAQWAAALGIINDMAQMETSNGSLKFPQVGAGSLLRKPLNEVSNMDGVIDATAANHVLAYGDFNSGMVIADRIGTTVEVVPHLMGANGRPTGQRGLWMWFRTGSQVVVPNALRLLNV